MTSSTAGAPTRSLRLDCRPEPPSGVRLQVCGEVDTCTAAQLTRALATLLGDGRPAALTVDLAGVGFVDGRGVAALVAAAACARSYGVGFTVVGCTRPVMRVFDVTGVTGELAATAAMSRERR